MLRAHKIEGFWRLSLILGLGVLSPAFSEPNHETPTPRVQDTKSGCPKSPELYADDASIAALLENHDKCFLTDQELQAYLSKLSLQGFADFTKRLRGWDNKSKVHLPDFYDRVVDLKANGAFVSKLWIQSLGSEKEQQLFRISELEARKKFLEEEMKKKLEPNLAALYGKELTSLKALMVKVLDRDKTPGKSFKNQQSERLEKLRLELKNAKTEPERNQILELIQYLERQQDAPSIAAASPYSNEERRFIDDFSKLNEGEKRRWAQNKTVQDLEKFRSALKNSHFVPQNIPDAEWHQRLDKTADFVQGVLEDPLWVLPSHLRALRDDKQFQEMDPDDVRKLHSRWRIRDLEIRDLLVSEKDSKKRGALEAEQKILRELQGVAATRLPISTRALPHVPAADALHLLHRDPLTFLQHAKSLPEKDRIELLRDLKMLEGMYPGKVDNQRLPFDTAIHLVESALPADKRNAPKWTHSELQKERRQRFTLGQETAMDLCEVDADGKPSALDRSLLAQAAMEETRTRLHLTDQRLMQFGEITRDLAKNIKNLDPNPAPAHLEAFSDFLTPLSGQEVRDVIANLEAESSYSANNASIYRPYLNAAKIALEYRTKFHEYQQLLDIDPRNLDQWAAAVPKDKRAKLIDFLYYAIKESRHLEPLGCPTQGTEILQNARRKLLAYNSGFSNDEAKFVDAIWRMNDEGIHALIAGSSLTPAKKPEDFTLVLQPLLIHLEAIRKQTKGGMLSDKDIDRPVRAAAEGLVKIMTPILDAIRDLIRAKDAEGLTKLRKQLADSGLWRQFREIALDVDRVYGPILSTRLKKLLGDRANEFNAMSILLADIPRGPAVGHTDTRTGDKSVVFFQGDKVHVYSAKDYEAEVKAELNKFSKLIELHNEKSESSSSVEGRFLEHFGKAWHFTNDFKSDATKAKDAADLLLNESRKKLAALGVADDLLKDVDKIRAAAFNRDTQRLDQAAKDAPYFAAAIGAFALTLPFAAVSVPLSAGGITARIVVPALVGGTLGAGLNYAKQKAEIADGVTGKTQVDYGEVLKHAGVGAGVGVAIGLTGRVGIAGARLLAIASFADASGNVVAHWEQGRKNEAVVDAASAGLSLWAFNRTLPSATPKAGGQTPKISEPAPPVEPPAQAFKAPPAAPRAKSENPWSLRDAFENKMPEAPKRPDLGQHAPNGNPANPNPPNYGVPGLGPKPQPAPGGNPRALLEIDPRPLPAPGGKPQKIEIPNPKVKTHDPEVAPAEPLPAPVEPLPNAPVNPGAKPAPPEAPANPGHSPGAVPPRPANVPAAVLPSWDLKASLEEPPPPPNNRYSYDVVWDEDSKTWKAYSTSDGSEYWEYIDGRWYKRGLRESDVRMFNNARIRYKTIAKTGKYLHKELADMMAKMDQSIQANQTKLDEAIAELKRRFPGFDGRTLTPEMKVALTKTLQAAGVPDHVIQEMLRAFSAIQVPGMPSTYHVPGTNPVRAAGPIRSTVNRALDRLQLEAAKTEAAAKRAKRLGLPHEALEQSAKEARFAFANAALQARSGISLPHTQSVMDAIYNSHLQKGIPAKARALLLSPELAEIGLKKLRPLFEQGVLGQMEDIRGFLAVIRANQLDRTAWLVFADYLDEIDGPADSPEHNLSRWIRLHNQENNLMDIDSRGRLADLGRWYELQRELDSIGPLPDWWANHRLLHPGRESDHAIQHVDQFGRLSLGGPQWRSSDGVPGGGGGPLGTVFVLPYPDSQFARNRWVAEAQDVTIMDAGHGFSPSGIAVYQLMPQLRRLNIDMHGATETTLRGNLNTRIVLGVPELRLNGQIDVADTNNAIPLPNLRTLHLEGLGSQQNFLRNLDAPNLRRLVLVEPPIDGSRWRFPSPTKTTAGIESIQLGYLRSQGASRLLSDLGIAFPGMKHFRVDTFMTKAGIGQLASTQSLQKLEGVDLRVANFRDAQALFQGSDANALQRWWGSETNLPKLKQIALTAGRRTEFTVPDVLAMTTEKLGQFETILLHDFVPSEAARRALTSLKAKNPTVKIILSWTDDTGRHEFIP